MCVCVYSLHNIYFLFHNIIAPCSKGEYRSLYINECKPCPKNTYQSSFGSDRCHPCEDNQYTISSSSIRYTQCLLQPRGINYINDFPKDLASQNL